MTGLRRGLVARPAAAAVSESARNLRLATRGMLLLSLFSLTFVVAGIRRRIPHETISPALTVFAGCLLAAAWLGLKARRQAVADRERASRSAMIIAIATQLGRQDDETLARIVAKGGPAAEAAAMVLQGRREPRRSIAAPSSWT